MQMQISKAAPWPFNGQKTKPMEYGSLKKHGVPSKYKELVDSLKGGECLEYPDFQSLNRAGLGIRAYCKSNGIVIKIKQNCTAFDGVKRLIVVEIHRSEHHENH